jgi:hypothetical protein
MKANIFICIMVTLFISCGDKNSSGGKQTSNGIDSNTRYVSMAGTASKVEYLNDVNYRIFKLRLLKNGRFFIYRNSSSAELIFNGKWRTEGTGIYLQRVGRGSYLQSNRNGIIYDCITLNDKDLGSLILKEFRLNRYHQDQVFSLRFCKRR